MTPSTKTHVRDARRTNGESPTTVTGPTSPRTRQDQPERDRMDSCCSPSSAAGDQKLGAGWLALLVPLLCCGGPLLIGAFAAAGAAAWGVLGGVLALVVGVALVAIRRRSAKRRRLAAIGQPAASRSVASPIGGALR
jgi:hypothetical protein